MSWRRCWPWAEPGRLICPFQGKQQQTDKQLCSVDLSAVSAGCLSWPIAGSTDLSGQRALRRQTRFLWGIQWRGHRQRLRRLQAWKAEGRACHAGSSPRCGCRPGFGPNLGIFLYAAWISGSLLGCCGRAPKAQLFDQLSHTALLIAHAKTLLDERTEIAEPKTNHAVLR